MQKQIGMVIAAACLILLGYFISVGLEAFSGDDAGAMPGGGGKPSYGGGPTSRPATKATSVEVAPSVVAAIRERVSGSGVLRPEREVKIIARTEGAIELLAFEAGQRVDEGFVLCHIDQRALSIAASSARIERDQAQAEYQRFAGLARAAVSDKEEQDARFAKERAESNYERASLELGYAKPAAPFGGVVVERSVEIGQHLRPGDEICTIADFDPLRMTLFFPESDVARIDVGQRVELRRARDTEIVAIGRVERVSPVVDDSSLTVEVVLDFPDAPESLRPGSFGVVDIITRTVEDACLVPKAALRRDDDGAFVFRVRGETAHRVAVTTGYQDDTIVQIREGLDAGDLVVVQGARDLRDGARVLVHREVPVRLDPLTVAPTETGPSAKKTGK